MKGQSEELQPGLYVVGTPIGNLEDLGIRALRVLREVDWIAAEDTRQTRKLLAHFGIEKPLYSLHEHSTEARVEELAERLSKGERGAYVSDAGTPGIADPGAALVRASCGAGVAVVPVPGPSAVAALVSVAGSDGAGFTFSGFFPRERKDREAWAVRAKSAGGLQVFFESPHRINACLAFLAKEFPEAELLVGRELTKKFETLTRGPAAEVAKALEAEEPRGEYCLALELGAPALERAAALGEEELVSHFRELAELGVGQKVLVKVGVTHGLSKNRAYELALAALGR
jgi:16S rRNA (cytidine1402-2'-O)-methyltransferase